jgi:malate dehydrogenase (oxaloacetate-decarboxylating)
MRFLFAWTRKTPRKLSIRVVVNGIGAAGVSDCKMLLAAGVERLVPVDWEGAIVRGEKYEQPMWQWLADQPQVEARASGLEQVIQGADVFIGVSRAGLLKVEHVKLMASNAIVFALANPHPEINPELAQPHVRVFATGVVITRTKSTMCYTFLAFSEVHLIAELGVLMRK